MRLLISLLLLPLTLYRFFRRLRQLVFWAGLAITLWGILGADRAIRLAQEFAHFLNSSVRG